MKKVFMLNLLLLVLTYTNAQPPGGGPPRGGRPVNNAMPSPRFEAKKLIGVMYYDYYEVLEKVKPKEDVVTKQLKDAFFNYNSSMENLYYANKHNLDALDLEVNAKQQSGTRNEGAYSATNLRQMIEDKMSYVKKEAGGFDKALNSTMEEILSKKQLKRWNSYQDGIKEASKPKAPDQNNSMQGGGPPSRR